MTKTGKTVSLRTAKFRRWVKKTFSKVATSYLTTESVASQAEEALGFPVSPNRVAREFYRQGITFRKMPGDPPEPAWSKNELNRARMDHLEERVRELELKVLGETKPRFKPRSRREISKKAKPAAAQE